MPKTRHFETAALAITAVLAVYFGAYFLTAEHIDVGDNTPLYVLRYRVGSVSLHHLASLFEPARRVDDLCLRRKHATVMH